MRPGGRSAKSAKRVRPGGFWHFWYPVTGDRAEKPDSANKLCLWTRLVPLASGEAIFSKYLIHRPEDRHVATFPQLAAFSDGYSIGEYTLTVFRAEPLQNMQRLL